MDKNDVSSWAVNWFFRTKRFEGLAFTSPFSNRDRFAQIAKKFGCSTTRGEASPGSRV
jgi:hypothetical protein